LCGFQIIRNTNYKYIRPLILGDRNCEDEGYNALKTNLNEYLNAEMSNGALKSASVYVREFEQGKWFAINPTETYSPGSMMKIATLITYLKDSEHNPDLLNQRIQFKASHSEMPVQSIVSGKLTSGRYYTVKELMEAMIINSDNDATMLLTQRMNANIYFDLCRSLNLSVPTKEQVDYPITTSECSRFLRVIFNSSYLESKNSEYAMNLLTKSKFNDGLTKLLPETISIAHKFGEKFNPIEQQLHETAIIYTADKPYLITVMTRGADQQKLKGVLNSISKKVYDFMASR
jgi:beta-lactamase class A